MTLETVVELTSIPLTLPCRSTPVKALNVTVAGWPRTILAASVSLNPATTCSVLRLVRVRKPLPAEPADAVLLELEPLDPLDEPDEPVPLAMTPTSPLMAPM